MGILGASNPAPGAGKSLNYIGTHIFGYSGIIEVDDTETTLIETVMGTGYAILTLDFGTGSASTRDMQWSVYIDGQNVYSYVSSGTNQAGANPQNSCQILVPGYSKFKITSDNLTDNNSEKQSVLVTGRVYA